MPRSQMEAQKRPCHPLESQSLSSNQLESTVLLGHPVFWIMAVAVLAPLLSEIPTPFKVPVVVLEVFLGIVIGPHVLKLVQFDGFVEAMFALGTATTLFMAGMELDFADIKGRPMLLAVGGWTISVLLSVTIVSLLHAIPHVRTPLVIALAMCTTGLSVVAPGIRDSGRLRTEFGRFALAAGTLGEVGPIVAMSLLLSQQYSIWQEGAFLLIFLVIIAAALAIGIGARPPKALEILGRHMNKTTQLPVRISVFMLVSLLFLAQKFGFETFTGAFAAGTILGTASRGEGGSILREKMETLSFGWFYPFFFVGAGIQFDLGALRHDVTTMLLVPAFAALFLVIRGMPVLLYRGHLDTAQLLPFAFSSAVPSLTIIVVITEIGVRAKSMAPDVAAAMIGAAMLSILLFPTIAGTLLSRAAATEQKSNMA
jgi:Kef-type K+ transport system membrane component KefB